MIRTYLDWLTELPWAIPEENPIDIEQARRILDEDHYDLEKIKRRIIEYLAVRKLAAARPGAHPLFCRTARRRKTSLGQSIARAMSRKVRAAVSSAAFMTKRKSAATAAPISARYPATSFRRSGRRARAIA